MPPAKRARLSLNSSSSSVTVKQEEVEDLTDYPVMQSFHEELVSHTGSEEDEENEQEDTSKNARKQRKGSKYQRYSRDDLKRARELVFQGKLSAYKASRLLNIPITTLSNHVRNRHKQKDPQSPLKKIGAKCQLTDAEEAELLEWLRVAAELGTSHIREHLLLAAADVLRLNKRPGFKNKLPSKKWLTGFITRHPQAMFVRRADETVDETRFFTRFHAFLARNNLLDALARPDAFYVMEDAYFELNTRVNNSRNRGLLRRALARQEGYPSYYRSRNTATLTYCFGADGRELQELMIFSEKCDQDLVNVARVDQEIKSNFLYALTKTGGQTRDSLKGYFHRLDQELKDVQRPIFFFCSKTLPHVDLDLYRWSRSRNIFIVNYMPGGVSVLEQCSEEIFGIDNCGWREETERAKSASGTFTEVEFVRLVKSINDRVISGEKIREIFENIGIFPFETSKVNENQEEMAIEETKVEHEAILQKLETMKELTRSLKFDFKFEGLKHLLMNAEKIEKQLETIENSL